MKIRVKNIGKVKEADIEIRGITVIAGPNDTGKSTISRALFSVFNSFYHIEEEMKQEREKRLFRIINVLFFESDIRLSASKSNVLVNKILALRNRKTNNNIENIDSVFEEYIASFTENDKRKLRNSLKKYSGTIQDTLSITDEEFFVGAMNRNLNSVFNHQINNLFSSQDGVIILNIKDNPMKITVKDNAVIDVGNKLSLNTEAVYLDNPFVLNELENPLIDTNYYPMQERQILIKLKKNTVEPELFQEIIVSKKLESVYTNINSVFSGKITGSEIEGWGRKLPKTSKQLDVRNFSAGLKTFAILKTLLLNGAIEENGTLILDEPEVHLHPEWQLVFARVIVELYKAFGLHILLNTHSPYFLRAIEVYAEQAGIVDVCKYYRAYNKESFSYIKDVTGNVEEIYKSLAGPLQVLENERYAD